VSILRTARYFPSSNVRYTIILKNACSAIQATLLEAEGIVTSDLTVAQTHDATVDFPDAEVESARTVVVVRDPLKRFMSAFLDRIILADFPATGRSIVGAAVLPLVRPDLADRAQASLLTPEYSDEKKDILEQLSLRDLARIVALTPDNHVENHFKSQRWFMGDRDYDVIVSMESPTWKEDLAEILGRPLVEMRPHATQKYQRRQGDVPDAAQLSVREMRARFDRDGTLPSPEDFLTDEITALLRRRYGNDFPLLASL
jgi:hypothetical protein